MAVLICTALAWGQEESTRPPPEQQEVARLQALADGVKQALASGHLEVATRLAKELGEGVLRREKAVTFTQLEAGLPAPGRFRFYALARVANAAYEATEYSKAEAYSKELISLAPEYKEDPYYGDAIFLGHTVLGRVLLGRDADRVKAKAALLASGRTPGSPALGSFGPNMSLAQELLAVGERDVVLEFFGQCRAFWKMHRKRLDEWSEVVKGCCRMPGFGGNLVYGFTNSGGGYY